MTRGNSELRTEIMGQIIELGDRLKIVRNEKSRRGHMKREVAKIKASQANAKGARSRARRLNRCVAWADRKAIAWFYAEAIRLTKQTGIQHEVDHVIPLQGRTVSGLHVEGNLRVIPHKENRRKHNHFDG
jgi:hypothetical protein